MTKITDKKLIKINELSKTGLSNHQIAKALGISYETVRKYKGEKKDVSTDKNIKSNKRDRKRGTGSPSDTLNKERKREPDHTIQDTNASGEKSESVESLIFVGGKKFMSKKEESKTDEEDEYKCYNCDYIQSTPFKICPRCGNSNSFEE